MSQNVAPWLQGLDEAWELPTASKVQDAGLQAGDDPFMCANTGESCMQMRNISGLPSSIPPHTTPSQFFKQPIRSPLATINQNDGSIRRPSGLLKLSGTRSFSGASDGSVLQYGTVQQRAKSTSPIKKQETLEWKKRLVHGKVGYGDRTDLFGPSGLENIFAQTRESRATDPKVRSSMNWLDRSAVASFTSSPPTWPRHSDVREPIIQEEDVEQDQPSGIVAEQDATVDEIPTSLDGSFDSNPFEPTTARGGAEDTRNCPPQSRQTADDDAQDETQVGRTVSGQTELEQEDFSPVFVSKHTTMTGQIDYKALDPRMMKQFQDMHVSLRQPSQVQSSTDGPSQAPEATMEPSMFTDGPSSEVDPVIPAPDFSLSENLPTGTPPGPALGKHVEVKRGGYSNFGSFKRRPLSSSQSVEPERSKQSTLLSPLPSSGSKLPPAPSTPNGPASLKPAMLSSTSPLKLFGPHDTFTNNRLLRRMSQIDPDIYESKDHDDGESLAEKTRTDEISDQDSQLSFGSGQYDSHLFNAAIIVTSASDPDQDAGDLSPGSDIPPPGSKTPLGFRLDACNDTNDPFQMERDSPGQSVIAPRSSSSLTGFKVNRPLNATVEDVSDYPSPMPNDVEVLGEVINTAKRPPNSPHRASSSKRRRTHHAVELKTVGSDTSRFFQEQVQDPVGSYGRKDVRKGEDSTTMDPSTLASRKIMRPRNPTPAQHKRQQLKAEIREATEEFAAQEPEKLEAVMEQIECSMASESPPTIQQQAQTVANEVAKFTLRVQKASGEHTARKRSVTTQDFFNEAVMVMKLIREKAGRQSGLGSVAESDQEAMNASPLSGLSEIEPSGLRVSRPPSRDGAIGWRPRTSQQTDARKLSHLRRFQDQDDTDFIAQSTEALRVDEPRERHMLAEDDESNVRIRAPIHDGDGLVQDNNASRPISQRSEPETMNSVSTNPSNATSTGRTFHTSSTRKSENLGTLAPDAVAHLIGDQVGGMTYDKEKQQWVRVKGGMPKRSYPSFLEPSNLSSDDDPFREISDLPVDEHREEEIRKVSTQYQAALQPVAISMPDEQPAESRTTSQETVLARPTTSGSSRSHHTHSSSIPSRYTALCSSQQQHVETRATSWSNEELEQLSEQGKLRQQPLAYAAAQVALAERNGGDELVQQQVQQRDMAVQPRPEPVLSEDFDTTRQVNLMDETCHDDSESLNEQFEAPTMGHDSLEIESIASPKIRQAPLRAATGPQTKLRDHMRQVSLRRQTLTNKFNAHQMREQSEVSFVAALPGERMMSVSLSVSRPLSQRQPFGQVGELPGSPSKYDSSFLLSDLPEFTVHDDDRERPSERALAATLARHAAADVDDRYALAVRDLVKTLTDVQEEELFWDDLKQLDLHDRSLASLHGLKDFCGKVQAMNVSDNALTQLDGAPSSIRNLFARCNQLSSLTSWAHLVNLQYLDVSGNRLSSLNGLSCLIHLREIRADDNEITGIDGIGHLDGLLKLRLRRNAIRSINFESSELYRLQELDLCENEFSTVEGLGCLPSLRRLKLDGNRLRESPSTKHPMTALEHLSLQRCQLGTLNVGKMPALRTLLLDDNELVNIQGIETLSMLGILSMRRQTTPGRVLGLFSQAVEARTIRLSGTHIPLLDLHRDFLSVQHLELASAGLQSLPEDFGLRFPNLQTVNLNFNSLKDLRPLLNIHSLHELQACGNRLDRLRKTAATLGSLDTLRQVDLRDNPLTQGFYASRGCGPSTSVIRRPGSGNKDAVEDDEDVKREEGDAAKYRLLDGDAALDAQHYERLDEGTKLRRRVYELLLADACAGLTGVDGLRWDKRSLTRKDKVWERLVELGIVRKSGWVTVG